MPTKTIKPKKVTKTAVAKKVAVKKTATKVPKSTKKAPAKKVSPKKSVKQPASLVCAPDGECFWTRDGRILQTLLDLHEAVRSMDDEVFEHHVNKEKNDFADWVAYVLRDVACAEALRKAKKRAQTDKVLTQHLQLYIID